VIDCKKHALSHYLNIPFPTCLKGTLPVKKILALIKLTRYKEYTFFVTVTTLLGIASAEGTIGWHFVGVWLANWLAVMFAFMINDVEDADDDALNPKKINRNPVSAGEISPRAAWLASFVVAALSGAIYYALGYWPFVLGSISLFLGFVYSWRRIRLKNMAFLDMASHCMMLAGLQFLPGYMAFDNRPDNFYWLFPFTFVTAVSLYGELFNELRDLEGDRKAGLRHTAVTLGPRLTYGLVMLVMAVAAYCGFVTIFLLGLIRPWVVVVLVAGAVLLNLVPMYRARRQHNTIALQESFHKPLEIAAAFALSAQFAGPWAWAILGPWALLLLKMLPF
jgi:4-hydroxybenzoate polyprenyltransferase